MQPFSLQQPAVVLEGKLTWLQLFCSNCSEKILQQIAKWNWTHKKISSKLYSYLADNVHLITKTPDVYFKKLALK